LSETLLDMKLTTRITVYCILLLIAISDRCVMAQDYSLVVSDARVSVDQKVLNGYATVFDMPYLLIKKEWWRYIKKRAIIFNHLTYYDLTIPAEGEANTPIHFASVLTEDTIDHHTTLRLALLEDQEKVDLQGQMKSLLIHFKISLFSSLLEKNIKSEEKKAAALSQKIDRIDILKEKLELRVEKRPADAEEIRKDITENIQIRKVLSTELDGVNSQLDDLKGQLGNIR